MKSVLWWVSLSKYCPKLVWIRQVLAVINLPKIGKITYLELLKNRFLSCATTTYFLGIPNVLEISLVWVLSWELRVIIAITVLLLIGHKSKIVLNIGFKNFYSSACFDLLWLVRIRAVYDLEQDERRDDEWVHTGLPSIRKKWVM